MTDQPKIEIPRKSLFERAEESFGTKARAPAPVPRDLAPPVNRRPLPKPAAAPAAASASPAPEPGPPLAEPMHFPEDRVHQIDRALLARHGLIQPEAQVTGLFEEFRIVKRRVLASVR